MCSYPLLYFVISQVNIGYPKLFLESIIRFFRFQYSYLFSGIHRFKAISSLFICNSIPATRSDE